MNRYLFISKKYHRTAKITLKIFCFYKVLEVNTILIISYSQSEIDISFKKIFLETQKNKKINRCKKKTFRLYETYTTKCI